ncbi:hypothetical protein DV738_g1451, partial [Chaetothyriales sp. CBS 135597]
MSRMSTASQTARPSNGLLSPTNPRNGGSERAVPVPTGGGSFFGGADRNRGINPGQPGFDLARSPPGAPSKNTKHVPCKFFKQGACQAGNACPFSHSLDPTTHQAPCKYFMKGNCKFGAKCALAHYLPDGRRVNRSDLEAGMALGGVAFGRASRPEPMPFPNLDEQSHFPNPFLSNPPFPLADTEDADAFPDRYNQYTSLTPFDSALNSPPLSHYGSPDTLLPRSPVDKVRTALDAPLPQSFDSNGVSYIAKYGPLGQSAPDKFGMRSPGSSLSRHISSPLDSLGFRSSQLGSNLRGASPLAASPQNNEESIGQRIMHSQTISNSRVISASMPRSNGLVDWHDPLDSEADLLPNSLHDDILTPQEKFFKRLSRPEQDGLAIPSGTASKVGSPPASGSPSRFSHLWAEQREKKAAAATATVESSNPTGFGHVGSPLQQSWMLTELPKTEATSGISQAMARMQFGRMDSHESNGGRGNSARNVSNTMNRLDRTVSSPGPSAKKHDEEGEVFFQMDDDTRFPGVSPRLAPQREKGKGDAFKHLSIGEPSTKVGGEETVPAKTSFFGLRP